MKIKVNISLGDFIDRMTILEIKKSRISDQNKLSNIKAELDEYLSISVQTKGIENYQSELFDINNKLWDVEDKIRQKEKLQEFDDTFIELARSVYKLNDIRANLKRQINIELHSDLVEEKQLP